MFIQNYIKLKDLKINLLNHLISIHIMYFKSHNLYYLFFELFLVCILYFPQFSLFKDLNCYHLTIV